jgi:hypothetical protein
MYLTSIIIIHQFNIFKINILFIIFIRYNLIFFLPSFIIFVYVIMDNHLNIYLNLYYFK